MNEDELRVLFRTQELARRAARRQAILNEAALEDEPLNTEDTAATVAALVRLRLRQSEYEALLSPRKSYWRNLWDAVRGRP